MAYVKPKSEPQSVGSSSHGELRGGILSPHGRHHRRTLCRRYVVSHEDALPNGRINLTLLDLHGLQKVGLAMAQALYGLRELDL
jgi:hypothetical protein